MISGIKFSNFFIEMSSTLMYSKFQSSISKVAVSRHFSQLVKNGTKIKLILYTKSNCSLCDTAKEYIEENYPNKFLIDEVDITKDKILFRQFKLDIPVFYYNGSLLMKHRADKNALDNLIREID
jgi:hypothetical protein